MRALIAPALLCAAIAAGCARAECDAPYECDIRDRACQREVLAAVQCLRGGDAVDVPVHVVDADAYEQEQLSAIDEVDAAQQQRFYDGLALLDLVDSELDLGEATHVSVSQVGAFYDPDERAVTILERGEALDQLGYVAVLAHELVHAQQDVEHDFDALFDRFGGTVDSSLALSAVTEGEAELYESWFSANALGFAFDDVRWNDALSSYRTLARKRAARSENPFLELRTSFVYPFGLSYVHDAFDASGRRGVAELYEQPPVSTRQVVAGFGAALPDDQPPFEPELDQLAVPQLEGFGNHVVTARYGAYAFETALAHWAWRDQAHDAAPPAELAAQLSADELTIQSDDEGRVVASWRLRFATTRGARAAAEAIEPRLWDVQRLARIDRDVILVASYWPALADLDLVELEWLPAPAEPEPDPESAGGAVVDRRVIRCPRALMWR